MSHEVTIGDLRASRWNVPDFEKVWRGLDPSQVGRFIREIHADVAQAISGYETALAVAEEERLRLEAEVLRLRGPAVLAADPADATAHLDATASPDAEPEAADAEPEAADSATTPSRHRRREAATAVA